MTTSAFVRSASSALLVMDYQRLLLDNYLPTEAAKSVLTKTYGLIEAARHAGVIVIYITVGFRAGHPEISSRNRVFSGIRDHGLFIAGSPESAVHPDVAPHPGDPVIMKHRIGAFTSTELGMLLDAQGVDTLIMAGLTTSGVVLSSVRQAFDLDYKVIVVSDCCADPDENIHRVLIDSLLPQHADVVLADVLAARLKSGSA